MTVALIVEKPDLFPDNWIYIHEPSVKVGRIQNFRSWSPEMVPNEHRPASASNTSASRVTGCGTPPTRADQARQERAGEDRPGKRDDIKDGCVVRQRRPIRSTTTTTSDNVETIREEIERSIPTLHLVGRNGMHKYNNQDHAMMTAMLTVKNILAGEAVFDVWNVNEDAEYHEAGNSGAEEALKSVRMVPRKVGSAA